jgi:GntR family transcriptional repressor for pyruvate dehydrogenase complex
MRENSDDAFSNIVKIHVTETVVERIEEMIVASRLLPGDALPAERDLAERLGVSRNALREALGVLQQKGLVTVLSGRGTFVARPGSAQMKSSLDLLLRMGQVSLLELSEARLLIEPELARMAAGRTALEKVALSQFLLDLQESSDDAFRHVRADLNFHGEIARLAGHAVYEAIVDAVREPVTRSMVFGTSVPRAIDTSDHQHIVIHDAILSGDGDGAWQHMRAHLDYVRDYLSRNEVRIMREPTDRGD